MQRLDQPALYAVPRGELRTELIACLRQARDSRRLRAQGADRRGTILYMVSIHVRPPEIEDRVMPGHCEGDLIKGARNACAVRTLVELARSSAHWQTWIMRLPLRQSLVWNRAQPHQRAAASVPALRSGA